MVVNLNFTQFGGLQPLDLTGVILAFIANQSLDGKTPPPVNIQWANHTNPTGGQSVLEIPGSLTGTLNAGDYYFNITALNPDGTITTYAAGTWPITLTPGTISGSAPTVPPILGPGYVKEAPNDGQPYERQSQAWVVNPVQEAPEDGNTYGRRMGAWYNLQTAAAGVPEAPLVGGPYWRENASWVADPVIEAPTDGQMYGRASGGWHSLIGYVTEAPEDGGTYGRHNGAWVDVLGDAPVDANTYGRYGSAWVGVVNKNGDSMSGALKITTANPQLVLGDGVRTNALELDPGGDGIMIQNIGILIQSSQALTIASGAIISLLGTIQLSGSGTLSTLGLDGNGDLHMVQTTGPNAGKSVNLTYGKWV
jgi:hypothetical protein